jgi:hypothetical protein
MVGGQRDQNGAEDSGAPGASSQPSDSTSAPASASDDATPSEPTTSEAATSESAPTTETDDGFAQWVADNKASYPSQSAVSRSFPAIPVAATRSTPETFLSAFFHELLSVDYAHASWDELMAWVRYHAAPPQTADARSEDVTVWVLSTLVDPPASTEAVVVSKREWAALAATRSVQAVRGVTVLPSRTLEATIGDGSAGEDPRTACFDVTVTTTRVTERQREHDAFTLLACTGTAADYDGYGLAGVAAVRDAR